MPISASAGLERFLFVSAPQAPPSPPPRQLAPPSRRLSPADRPCSVVVVGLILPTLALDTQRILEPSVWLIYSEITRPPSGTFPPLYLLDGIAPSFGPHDGFREALSTPAMLYEKDVIM